jgi:hypothetical protein
MKWDLGKTDYIFWLKVVENEDLFYFEYIILNIYERLYGNNTRKTEKTPKIGTLAKYHYYTKKTPAINERFILNIYWNYTNAYMKSTLETRKIAMEKFGVLFMFIQCFSSQILTRDLLFVYKKKNLRAWRCCTFDK